MPDNQTLSEAIRLESFLGFGLGLRKEFYDTVVEHQPAVDWFEINSENYMVEGGRPLYYLDKIGEKYPIVMHGVSLGIGNVAPLDTDYLKQLNQLAKRTNPQWISDHLCWTGYDGNNLHDLMPLPYTEEAVKHIAQRVTRVQETLGQRILLENVSSYVTYKHSRMPEWTFFTAVAEQADCLILLDINNIYVSAKNHEFDPLVYIDNIPKERVWQFHLAGHSDFGNYAIDTHDHAVIDPVWELYEHAIKRFGRVSTMIERDDNMPQFAVLMDELEHARRIGERVIGKPQ